MRIVGGEWRGRALEAPAGRDTRPTTDRMRETIASMVMSAFDLDLSDASVLDAFAGSGALGLEMLSRGAAHCTFVERDRRAAAVVRANVAALGAHARSCVLCTDALRLAGRAQGVEGAPFGLVLLDPPYAMAPADVASLVGGLAACGSLASGALVLYERSSSAPPLGLSGATLVREREHGITTVDLYRIEAT